MQGKRRGLAALREAGRRQSPHSTAVAGSVPTVKDRIVQTAVKFVLEPIFEATFCPTSYGFRPGLGCRDALREVAQLVKEGHTFVVDGRDAAGASLIL
jgi:hypothetical protein